ncbi:MAG TPA: 3-deoxy-7-phosphoheptulonate synthase [Clostridiales bacterium UBA8960]|jgi:3-deoxy-7-phosphoheptulonate synthase|nr:3-deoxy-7-phosphoheptulonate synthase [Clostridiales bacterium UBA8960]
MISKFEVKPIKVGHRTIGGNAPVIIAGPCSVESAEQIMEIAIQAKHMGVNFLRGGIFKPRTSPHDFQGLGLEGLDFMVNAGKHTGLAIVTELMDAKHLDLFVDKVDVIQIGSRNMYNYALLKAVGETKKPILLKRGFSATIREWIMAAEHIAKSGNDNIIFCERGIRTFEDYTRNTLDLTAVPIIQKETGLPIIVDPSHGTGIRELVGIMSEASIACGANGLMIEAHTNPELSISDKAQTVDMLELSEIVKKIEKYK